MDGPRGTTSDDAVSALVAGVRARQLAVFHMVGVLAFTAYTGFWYAAGVTAAAQLCAAALAAMVLNASLGGPRWRARASGDVAIGITACSVFVMAVMLWHDVPIIVSWSVFAPVFGWLLGSPRRAALWAGIVTGLIAVGGVLVYREPVALRSAQLSYQNSVVFTCAHAVSMVAIAIAAMWMLDQSHRVYLATMHHQQAELVATNARLADSQRHKDRFYQAMSHELRTPMNAVSGIAELIDDDHATPGERRELAIALRQAATHLSAIVSDVLDLTHMNEQQFKLAVADFDLHEAVATAIATARAAAAEPPPIALDLTAAPRPVRGDRRRLIQVVATLVTTAVAHAADGPGEVALQVAAQPTSTATTPPAIALDRVVSATAARGRWPAATT
ncbi:MAG: HAMP domain-containing sensor histidine kinase [Kofleriaceae bacterium]